ncbi:hypothetical protein [Nocardia terpenica]|nr:hypothetical protein [Nocardia terpenica]
MTHDDPEDTPILRLSIGLYRLWTTHLELTNGLGQGPMLDEISDAMDVFYFLLDREAAACLTNGPFPRPDAEPSKYPYSIRVSALARTCAVANYLARNGKPTREALGTSLRAALNLDKLVEAVNQGTVKLTSIASPVDPHERQAPPDR